MKNLVWHILLCVALAASAWASNKVDAEQVAKEHKASFHLLKKMRFWKKNSSNMALDGTRFPTFSTLVPITVFEIGG